ncbi:putative enoyl-CoA hydratase echA8 [Polycladomyces abyssicola]|uniref:Putative enoyl-CoA hydratase echA8 n=1 Tax=Polycladomyces abyssicola TaxID=1125966 RepID=A0A8D5UDA9_9BACL|nr:enoyl-CoA hydratase/isomerase family protein [Polycladomyces abyssicola]BCU80608.1 putative enoyl-CoA hydratase echA8 [Polycladomyces abyssicola]
MVSNNYETIKFYVEEGVAFLVLSRPPVNVMNIQMMEEISDALFSIRSNRNLHALVIRAEGKVFSAGVSVEDHMGDKAEPMLHLFHKMFHLLIEIPCPTIAVVEGPAIGGGCELATFCDIVYATEKAKFGQPEINLGLFPPVSVVTFPWLTGFNRTMELLLTGETIDAHKAYEWGFVNRVLSPEDLETNLKQLLSKLKNKSTVALRLTRKAVREAMASSFASSIGKVEQIYFRDLIQSEDAQEGLRSFIEKREPVWKNS